MGRIRLPSRAMAVALLALFLNLAGIGYAATGGKFILGKGNSASSTTALTGSAASGPAFSVKNATSGLPAAAFKVTGMAPPFTVGSQTKVANLNADLLDGLSASSFEPAANVLRMDALMIPFGQDRRFDLGPYFSLDASCFSQNGTPTLDEVVLNNAPGTMTVTGSELLGPPAPVTPRVVDVGISSGGEATFQELKLSGSAVNAGNHATLIARDNTGETVTGVFAGYVAAGGCLLVGTLTKAT